MAPGSAFEADGARIRFQLVEDRSPPICSISFGFVVGTAGHKQIVERALAGSAELFKHKSAPTLLEAMKSRADKPIDAASRRWFDAQRTATLEQGLTDVVFSRLLRQHPLGKPGDELGPILDRCFAETQELPDLSAVVFDRAAGPLVARVQICRYVDLVGDVDDDSTGYVLLLAGKAP